MGAGLCYRGVQYVWSRALLLKVLNLTAYWFLPTSLSSPLVPPSYNVVIAVVVVVVVIVVVEMMNDNEKSIQGIPRLNEKYKTSD